MMFSEVIKVQDGVFYNLSLHQERMNRTARLFFGCDIELNLSPEMIPNALHKGLVKCWAVYGRNGVTGVEFTPYIFREIKSVAIVCDDQIDYTYKSTDRSCLNMLLTASGYDEIIIVKRGLVTDASSANIVLENSSGILYTPSIPLLAGTKRASLLKARIIRTCAIRPEDLYSAKKIYLINAMIDIEDHIELSKKII